MSRDINRRSQDGLTDLLQKIQSNLVDDVDDLDDQISELKGVLNETLGDLPFKFAILLVVFLNFLYTSYDAYFATRITSMITNECYCHPTDRTFYRSVMMLSMIVWILVLFIYGTYSTFGRQHIVCARHNEIKTNKYVSKTHEDLVKLLDVLEKKEKTFQAQLRELVTTKFLDDDHCESIRQHYYSTSLYWKTDTNSSGDPHDKTCEKDKQDGTEDNNSKQTNGEASVSQANVGIEITVQAEIESGQTKNNTANYDTESGQANGQNHTGLPQANPSTEQTFEADSAQNEITSGSRSRYNSVSVNHSQGSDDLGELEVTKVNKKSIQEPQSETTRRWYCFMFLKVSLIALRFIFRLLIVPLLQLQLFNDYAWYCLLNNIVRNYCETETSKYYIGLDHSLVNYCMYILLLIALLFSFLINWFPKGIPQVVLLYKAGSIMINKKGLFKSQFDYKKLVNESDTA